MIRVHRSTDLSLLRHGGAALAFVMVITCCIAAIWVTTADLMDRRATVAATDEMLAQLEGRAGQRRANDGSPMAAAPPGSPFLAGATVNVAGAALLQRVGGAVTKAGGTVLSSQVELQRADPRDGWIGLVVSCELPLPALQKLLYDVESGMPFVYIDQVAIQAATPGTDSERTRVLLGVSAQWKSGK